MADSSEGSPEAGASPGGSRLPLLGALALFLLAEAVLFHVHTFPLVRGETDGIEYMQASEEPIFQAHPYHGPGYPLAIRSVRALGVGPFAAGKAVSVAPGWPS